MSCGKDSYEQFANSAPLACPLGKRRCSDCPANGMACWVQEQAIRFSKVKKSAASQD